MQNEKLHTTTCPGNAPETELYRFGADGNLWLYSYDRLFYSLYGYDGGTTRTYKYSFDLNPNWVNGRLENVNFFVLSFVLKQKKQKFKAVKKKLKNDCVPLKSSNSHSRTSSQQNTYTTSFHKVQGHRRFYAQTVTTS